MCYYCAIFEKAQVVARQFDFFANNLKFDRAVGAFLLLQNSNLLHKIREAT